MSDKANTARTEHPQPGRCVVALGPHGPLPAGAATALARLHDLREARAA